MNTNNIIPISQNNSKKELSHISSNKSTTRAVEYHFGKGGLANMMFGLVSSYVIAALLNATLICLYSKLLTYSSI